MAADSCSRPRATSHRRAARSHRGRSRPPQPSWEAVGLTAIAGASTLDARASMLSQQFLRSYPFWVDIRSTCGANALGTLDRWAFAYGQRRRGVRIGIAMTLAVGLKKQYRKKQYRAWTGQFVLLYPGSIAVSRLQCSYGIPRSGLEQVSWRILLRKFRDKGVIHGT